MGKPKVYLSIPFSIPEERYHWIINSMKERYKEVAEITYYDRIKKQTYTTDQVDEAEFFVVVHPNNKFEYHIESLPVGVKTELKRFLANRTGDFVYGLYVPSGRTEFSVYESLFMNEDDTEVKLRAGSTADLWESLESYIPEGGYENVDRYGDPYYVDKPVIQQLPTGYGKSIGKNKGSMREKNTDEWIKAFSQSEVDFTVNNTKNLPLLIKR
jgi:hypothetical protein